MTTEEALKIANAPMGGHLITVSHDALRTLADALREAQAQTVQMREDAAKLLEDVRYVGGHKGAVEWRTAIDAIRALPAPAARTYDDGVRDAAKAAEGMAEMLGGTVAGEGARSAVGAVEALLSPAPAARTYEDARREGVQAAFDAVHRVSALPYMDSPRSAFDAARIMREACQDAVQALLSPAPAVAPVAQKHDLPECDDCDGKGGFDGYGKPSDHPSALRACESCDGTGRVAPVAAPKPGPTPLPERVRQYHGLDEKPVAFDAEAALVAMAKEARREIPTNDINCDTIRIIIDAGLNAGRGAR